VEKAKLPEGGMGQPLARGERGKIRILEGVGHVAWKSGGGMKEGGREGVCESGEEEEEGL
jgi:hypothetical protein